MAARGPQPVHKVIREVMTRHGLGREMAAHAQQRAWQEAVGEALAPYTRCGSIRRQRLDVVVANSTLIQELTFQKQELLNRLKKIAPELRIQEIRFRVGSIS
jgi:predicted nucleic acid-binding Zn ribbon protein